MSTLVSRTKSLVETDAVEDATLDATEAGKRAAFDAADLLAVHVFHFDDIEGLARFLVRVREQVEREAHLRPEVLVGLQAVARDAVDVGAGLPELGVKVAKLLAFGRAAGRVVL